VLPRTSGSIDVNPNQEEEMALSLPRTALVAIGGPALIGLAIGMPSGARTLLAQAAVVPAIVLGISVFMIPALYIGTTLIGAAPPAVRVARSSAAALQGAGTLLLGLAPASLFLIATSQTHALAWVLGLLVLGAGALVFLRTLFLDAFETSAARLRALPVFLVWAAVCLGLGGSLLLKSLPNG
jgi:hypothetical protein